MSSPLSRRRALAPRSASRASIAVLLALSSTAATCGDNVPGITTADYLAARADASCERLVRCGLFTDAAACAAYFPTEDNADLLGAVAEGSVVFSAVDAPYCLDSIAAVSCDTTQLEARTPLACPRAFTGTLDAGATCALDEQCTTGTCARRDCEIGTCCTGTCMAPQEANTACTTDAECAAPLTCGVSGTCAPAGAEGSPCRRDSQCGTGTGCTAVTLDPGVCRKLPALAEVCPYQRCADLSTRCDGTTCVSNRPGEPCNSDAACNTYSRCDAIMSRCVAQPVLGEPCETRCEGDSFCDRSSNSVGVCTAPFANGTPCDTADQCTSDVCAEGPLFDACSEPQHCF